MNIEDNGYFDPDLISFEAVSVKHPETNDDVFVSYVRFWKGNTEKSNPVDDGKSFLMPIGNISPDRDSLIFTLFDLYNAMKGSTFVSSYVPIFDSENGNVLFEIDLETFLDNPGVNMSDETAKEETKPDSEGTVVEQV